MVTTKVKALIDGVRDNGKKYAKDDEFNMEISLVAPHVKAGQVKVVSGSRKPVKKKRS
jgi:hypothetical protein